MINKILQGDCKEILPQIPTESIHAIISDIPYGIGHEEWDILHKNQNSALGGASEAQKSAGSIFKRRGKPLNGWSKADKSIPLEYQNWCASWSDEWLRVLKPGASCFVFAGRRYAHRCITALEDAGFTFKDSIAWQKAGALHRAQRLSVVYKNRNDEQNAKIWEGWRLANLKPLYEPILWFQKPYTTGTTLASNVLTHEVGAWNEAALSKYNTLKEREFNFANIIRVANSPYDDKLHPTQKPLELMKCLIELVSLPGHCILDPFAGSATTCMAAKLTQRDFIGIEISPQYVQLARKRLQEINCQLDFSNP